VTDLAIGVDHDINERTARGSLPTDQVLGDTVSSRVSRAGPQLAIAVPTIHPGVQARCGGSVAGMCDLPHAAFSSLSARELEVLRGLVAGFTNRQIAVRLEISERTVQSHVAAALTKTQSTSRTHLAVRAVCGRVVEVECCGCLPDDERAPI